MTLTSIDVKKINWHFDFIDYQITSGRTQRQKDDKAAGNCRGAILRKSHGQKGLGGNTKLSEPNQCRNWVADQQDKKKINKTISEEEKVGQESKVKDTPDAVTSSKDGSHTQK